jgi:hypothetical protein
LHIIKPLVNAVGLKTGGKCGLGSGEGGRIAEGRDCLDVILSMTGQESKQEWVYFIVYLYSLLRSSSASFNPLDLKMLMAIFSILAVALYLVGQWWAIDDIVKTSEPSREGLKQVIQSHPSMIPVHSDGCGESRAV